MNKKLLLITFLLLIIPIGCSTVLHYMKTPAPCTIELLGGIRLPSTLTYSYVGKWQSIDKLCVLRAFNAWSKAIPELQFQEVLETTYSNIGLLRTTLGYNIGGRTIVLEYDYDGFIKMSGVALTTDPRMITTCEGIYKVALHEIGHVLGLGHPFEPRTDSVMNSMFGTNDLGGSISAVPSTCDVALVRQGSQNHSPIDRLVRVPIVPSRTAP
jgi:hypothetical protein